MSSGLIRLRIVSVNFLPDFAVKHNEFVVRLELNKQVVDIHSIPDAGFIFFECIGDHITIMLADPTGQAQELGQANIQLAELLKFPEALQKITVHLAVRDKHKGWIERDAAILVLEFLHTTKPFEGQLSLKIVNANLTHDTEMAGEMDPYVVIRHLGQEHRTKTLRNKGKHPYWDQKFLLPIKSVNDLIELRVMDQDVMKDDEVGRAVINIREAGFLSMGPPVARSFDLVYKNKPAGVLNLEGQVVPLY